MATVRAADLPEGSIVAERDVHHVYIKAWPSGEVHTPWGTLGGIHYSDAHVDEALTDGRATVLRHGYGEDPS